MRNLFLILTAGLGAWWMAAQALQLGGGLVEHATTVNPLSGLMIAPAVLFGALVGAMLGALAYPSAR